MTVKIFSAILKGCCVIPVSITVSSEDGYGISISGLITQTINRDLSRVQFALMNCGFGFKGKRLHIDVQPPIFDEAENLMLAIALGMVMATGKSMPVRNFENFLVIGGLGVTGNVHEVDDAVTIAAMAYNNGVKTIILPVSNIKDSLFVCPDTLFPVSSLNETVSYLRLRTSYGKIKLPSELLQRLNFN